MSLIVILIVGGLVGWIASQVAGRSEGLIMSIIIGVVGAFIGSFLSGMLFGQNQSFLTFTWAGIFWSFIGALILVGILNTIQSRSNQRL